MEAKELEKLVKYYHENKISHAYLIETNNIDKCFLDLKCVVKQIFCSGTFDRNFKSIYFIDFIDSNLILYF